MPDAATIQQMFADVAPGYDRANRALSLGIDVLWRRKTVRVVNVEPGERGLDVCSGTGDLCFSLQRAGAEMLGADFCAPMLSHTHRKQKSGPRRPEFVAAHAMSARAPMPQIMGSNCPGSRLISISGRWLPF